MTSQTARPAALLAVLFLAACNNGSGTPALSEPQGFFAEVSIGAGGSLPTDGVPIEVRGAVLRRVDDGFTVTVTDPAELGNHLAPGSVVVLRGALRGDTAYVAEVIHRAAARGALAGRGESSLAVAGVEAVIGPESWVLDAAGEPIEPGALAGGAYLEVNGWSAGGARLQATGIRMLPGAPALRLRGYARAAAVDGVFPLALLSGEPEVVVVDARDLSVRIQPEARVRVEGTGIIGGVLAATGVAVESELLPFPGDRVVIEGVVTRRGEEELAIGPHRVLLGEGVAFEEVPAGGTGDAALAQGARVRVRGTATGPDAVVTADAVRLVGVHRLAGRIERLHVGAPATFASFELDGMPVGLGTYTSILDVNGDDLTVSELVTRNDEHGGGLPVVVHGHAQWPDPELGDAIWAYRVQVAAE